MNTYAEVIMTRPFLQAVIDELSLKLSAAELESRIVVTLDAATQILKIQVLDKTPERAGEIANAIAQELMQRSPGGATGSYTDVQAQVSAEIDKLQEIVSASEVRIQQLEAMLRAETEVQASPPDSLNQDLIDSTQARIQQLQALLKTTTEIQQQRELVDQLLSEQARLSQIQGAGADRRSPILNEISIERSRLTEAHRSLALLYASLGASFTNQVKIIEPAAPGGRLASQLQLRTLMGSLAGLALALILALVIEYFDPTLKVAEDVMHVSGMPALGLIPKHKRISGVGQQRLVIRACPESAAAEAYRLLSTKLLFHPPGDPAPRSILVSSVQGEADHTEIAANLALALAQAGRRVIVVDADLRQSSLGQLFGAVGQRNLTDILIDPSGQPPDLAPVEGVNSLTIVPAGSTSLNPLELLASAQMVNLIKQLERQADTVLIAASSPLQYADSLILASHVNGVILVARAGETRRQAVTHSLENLRPAGADVIGIVFNNNRRGGRLGRLSPEALGARDRWLGAIAPAWRKLRARLAKVRHLRTPMNKQATPMQTPTTPSATD
jgi:capsular exopolysaccharide synthesis family protein